VTGPSIRSLLAVRDEGLLSAGVVVGAATYQVMQPMGCNARWGFGKAGASVTSGALLEYVDYVDGVAMTWRDAIERLEREAVAAAAHGVTGIAVRQEKLQNQQGGYQVQLVGSGVVVPGVAPLKRPFLSMLSMPDTLKLLLRGWIPTGIGVGASALHVHGLAASSWYQRGAAFKNAEMDAPTLTVNQARNVAEERLRRCTTLAGAHTVVGTAISVDVSNDTCYVGTGLKMVVLMTGTGVVRFREATVPIDPGYRLSTTRGATTIVDA
jgi:uncharacterized protein YbjQ (UPF0145 family)